MEPLSTAAATAAAINAALAAYEKVTKIYREWSSKLPESPAKAEATRELAHAEDSLQVAKVELAKGFGYKLCRQHFPPGIMVELRERDSVKCETCGDIIANSIPQEMHYHDNVYWLCLPNGKEEGPFCPKCYGNEKKPTRMSDLSDYGAWSCPVCQCTIIKPGRPRVLQEKADSDFDPFAS